MVQKYFKQYVRYFDYLDFRIFIYPSGRETEKAKEFRLFDTKGHLTHVKFWIPKSCITAEKRSGTKYTDINWIFDEYKNKEKLRMAGYSVW